MLRVTSFALLAALSASLPVAAQASAPRDAIRQLPELTHTSTLTIDYTSRNGTVDHQERYEDTWDIRWRMPDVHLGESAIVRSHWFQRFTTHDRNLNGAPDDLGNTWSEFALNLSSPA